MTDGTNNKGDISPMTAAEIAKSFGIRVYTIGVDVYKRQEYKINEIAVAGGVSANNGLRNAFREHAEKYGWNIFIPKFRDKPSKPSTPPSHTPNRWP